MHYVGTTIVEQFPVWELDGYTKKSGETVFQTSLWLNGVANATPVQISEISTTGEYKAIYTPDVVGQWKLEIKIPYNEQVWYQERVVTIPTGEAQLNAAYDDDSSTLYLDVWADRDNTSVSFDDLISCDVELFDFQGTSLFSISSNSPSADGRFRFTQNLGLTSDRPYSLQVTIQDSFGQLYTQQAFTTAL